MTTLTRRSCWPDLHCPPLMGSNGCWMQQLMSSVVLGSSTVAWCSYVTLSCIVWTFLNVSSISLEWLFTGVFKAWRPSRLPRGLLHTYFTCLQPSVSWLCQPLPAHRSTTSSQQVWPSGILCCRPDDLELCMTISTTQRLVLTSLEQHWRHTFLQVSEHVAH